MTQNPDAAPSFDPDEVWTVKQFTSARNALRFYRVMALLTGTMLMILTVEMLYKYLYVPFVLGGSPSEALNFGGFDLAAAIAISHGWCYVVYLIACFWLNQAMRWKLGRRLILALAGVVPVMSFILERRIHRQVETELEAAVVVAPKE
jgi:integral membrane protein